MTAAVQPEPLKRFNPPAYLKDFEGEQLDEWSKTVDGWFKSEIDGKVPGTEYYRTPLTKFFNPLTEAFDQSLPPVPITWVGFPLKIRITHPTDDARWAAAENPDNQTPPGDDRPARFVMDEYLEWSTKKDENGDVIIASFTCEGPEYWKELAKYNPIATSKDPVRPPNPEADPPDYGRNDKILNIYKQLNPDFADEISGDDLVDENGVYTIYNKWNGTTSTGTIAHLIQRNNTLSAEIDIAAQATISRKDLVYNEPLTNMITLCGDGSGYGNASRNSDPTIGAEVNTLCRLPLPIRISVMDPIALYMHDADFSSFMLDPTGKRRGNVEDMTPVPKGVFDWCDRGDIQEAMGLHLKVKIPEGMKTLDGSRDLNVSDLFDLNNGGQYVLYGSQFADYITMSVSGVVGPKPENPPAGWPGEPQYALKYTEPLQPKRIEAPWQEEFPGALAVSRDFLTDYTMGAPHTNGSLAAKNPSAPTGVKWGGVVVMQETVDRKENEYKPLRRKIYNDGL